MAPPPMGRLNGSFVNGGRKDEPDLPDWNTGFSYYKDGCLDLLEHLRTDKNTEENCHALHELLFEETLYGQKIGKPFVDVLNERGVLPGIKVDKGTIEVVGTHKKTTTHGHDDLGKHCAKYYEAGAQFAKWRAVLKIGPNEPSEEVVLQISGINRSAATNKIGNLVSKYIFMMSTGDDGGFGSEGNSATHTTGGNHQSGTDLATDHKPIVILDTGAEVNVTGHEAMFVPVSFQPEGFGLRAANGNEIKSYMCGYLLHEMYHMNYVYFSEDVGPRTIISGPELDMLGYSLKFEGGTCEVRDKGFLVGKGCLVEKKRYLMEFLKIPLNRVPVQVPNVQENVPVPDGPVGRPLSVLIPVWTAIREVLRRFSGSLFKPEEAPRRPPV